MPQGKGKPTPLPTKAPLAPKGASVLVEFSVGDLAGIDHGVTWNAIADKICMSLRIPSLTSRRGLKEVHNNFTKINKQLNAIFGGRDTPKRVRAGVVAIWGKMSTDAKLRDEVFDDGLLGKVVPLLNDNETRQLALQVLSAVTHHGGGESRVAIALRTPTLLELMKKHQDDAKTMELATITMSHAIGAVIFVDDLPSEEDVKAIGLADALRAVAENLKKPTASQCLIEHALVLFTSATRDCYKQCNEVPAVASFLVACLRAEDITVRVLALGGIVRLFQRQCEQDTRVYDPHVLMVAARKPWPDKLKSIMLDYGIERCNTSILLRTTTEYQKAMLQVVRDRDLAGLGRTLAQLILRTEFSIVEGGWRGLNPHTGQVELMDHGLPFQMWTDALPHCARALRATGTPSDLDMADIVDLKFLIMRQRLTEAVVVAELAIKRNPCLAYAHYAISLGPDGARGLRAAKIGLKCPGLTPFVRDYLLWRAVDHAANMGSALLEVGDWETDKAEGTAFLVSALEDAERFLGEAPPDNRHTQTILNWYMILRVVLDGPSLSTDLTELDEIVMAAKISDEFNTFLGVPSKKTQLRLIRELILKLYADAAEEWKDVMSRFDRYGLSGENSFVRTKAEDDIEDWLGKTDEDDGAHEPPSMCGQRRKPQTTSVGLYRCSWCGNPSAVLRRCGRCSKTRYCDAACQKADWKQHKAACKPASST